MKGSLIIVFCFVAGVAVGIFQLIPTNLLPDNLSVYVLYALMFGVGISIGYDKDLLASLRKADVRLLLVPLGTIIGTFAGSAVAGLLLPARSIADTLAVGAGFGYYSLSSIFITQYKGAEWGSVALASNMLREIVALLSAPLLVRWFGPLAPISVAGATSMDTTLPIITKFSGKQYVLIAVFHGIVVDLTVPFFVTFFCWLGSPR